VAKDLTRRRKMKALDIFKQECRNWRARREVYRYLSQRHPDDLVLQHTKWIKAVLDAAETSVKVEELAGDTARDLCEELQVFQKEAYTLAYYALVDFAREILKLE